MRVLGKTNLKVNDIGCGGIPIQRLTQQEVNEMINVMIDQGVNFIDTARGYSNSEMLIGNAIEGKREYFILATKSMARTYDAMKLDIETSLRHLKTNYIDLYQLHNVPIGENIEGAIKALEEAKMEKKIGHIGITSHSIEMLEKAIEDNYFETVQFPYNIVEKQAEKLFSKANKNNIGVIVMKPLAGGAITDPELALKYILNNEDISVIIPGMESVEQIISNNSVKPCDFTVEEEKKIAEIRKELNNDFCRRCGYCMPCPKGINIPFTFLCEGYYLRYNLQQWALERYNSMKVKPSACIKCGLCESKCPYNLMIRKKLQGVAKIMEEKNEK